MLVLLLVLGLAHPIAQRGAQTAQSSARPPSAPHAARRADTAAHPTGRIVSVTLEGNTGFTAHGRARGLDGHRVRVMLQASTPYGVILGGLRVVVVAHGRFEAHWEVYEMSATPLLLDAPGDFSVGLGGTLYSPAQYAGIGGDFDVTAEVVE
jgi:hypothetical protein